MANMSYCRFENTLSDLEDCYEHIDDEISSEQETEERNRLILLCVEIANGFDEDELEEIRNAV